MIAEIIIDIKNKQVNRSFDYIVPKFLEDIIDVGYRVTVPFGNTKRVGFVTKLKDSTEFKSNLKEILELVDVYPVLNEEFIGIAKYIAENNFSFYATALQTMIPTSLKVKYKRVARVINREDITQECKEILKRNECQIDGFDNNKLKIVYGEVKKGNVILDTIPKKKKDSNEIAYVRLNDTDIKPSSKQGAGLVSFLEEINDSIELSVLLEDSGYSKSVVDTLARKGIISIYTKEIIPLKEKNIDYPNKVIEFNKYQLAAYKALKLNEYKTYLLHGITGSGKTEVYMKWIEDAIKANKTAIMLVPEISLTPQITGLFQNRFGSEIAILHSRLTLNEKYNEWKRIYNKSVKIVVGARSAIFAPLDNLGIIIIDECHEQSYIQQNNPKYNAIEIAKLRGANHSCCVVLGSATPNVSDYYYATNGEYELLSMPVRANGKLLPRAKVIDLKEELQSGNRSVLSRELQRKLKSCYDKREQSILFLNRRGYSSFVMCRSCGESVKCPNCDISLTYHANTQSLKCHYCGFHQPNVMKCHSCGSDKILFVGSGTEKIIEAAQDLIPGAKILRVDLDTAAKIEDYEAAFYKFKNHEADILVGTQMITKGLDFKDVTLVGVVNADLALSYPLFDASQVAFNLIEQVSGRAGRADKDGEVIIQTYNPKHYVIECAKNHDYESFYNFEIRNRRVTQMPPYSTVIEIMVQSKDANKAYEEAKIIVENLKKEATDSIILGPAEDMIFKKNNVFRFVIQIQAVEDRVLNKIKYLYPLYQNNKDISLSITRMW